MATNLNAIQNVMIGQEVRRAGFILDEKANIEKATKWLDYVSHGTLPDYKIPVGRYSVAQQQLVEIAKALSHEAKIIVMDEPTATLTDNEVNILFEIIDKLKECGVTIIYVSHRMEELFKISDRITILRDGKFVGRYKTNEITEAELIQKMIDREITQNYPPRRRCFTDEVILEANNITSDYVTNASFKLRKGEILGFAGLVGSGRTELMRAIFGADRVHAGTIKLYNKSVKIKDTKEAVCYGIGFATEDRKSQGLFLDLDIKENINVVSLKDHCKRGVINRSSEISTAEKYVDELNVATPTIYKRTAELSGGNQQKVILARWLAAKCDILILDEPTRGIDVGAKYEIYLLMDELVQQGKSIIMISSELPELLSLSDRVYVMYEGTIMGELDHTEFSQEKVMTLASGLYLN